jgi:hypothetical protein
MSVQHPFWRETAFSAAPEEKETPTALNNWGSESNYSVNPAANL